MSGSMDTFAAKVLFAALPTACAGVNGPLKSSATFVSVIRFVFLRTDSFRYARVTCIPHWSVIISQQTQSVGMSHCKRNVLSISLCLAFLLFLLLLLRDVIVCACNRAYAGIRSHP